MNVVEVNFNEITYPKCSFNINDQNMQIYSPFCHTLLTENSEASLFENGSNNTRDSSLSSSCSHSYLTKATDLSLCCSNKSLDQSHNSNYSTPKIDRSPNVNENILHEEKFDNNSLSKFHETPKNRDLREEVVKITKTLSLEFTCSTRITPPQINDCPEIIKSHHDNELESQENDQLTIKSSNGHLQLIADQNKLTKAEFMSNMILDNSTVSEKSYEIQVEKLSASKEIQTLPVLILPMSTEDKMIETEEDIITAPTVIQEQSQSKESENIIQNKVVVETCQKETQASGKYKQRRRTSSELNSISKSKENKITNKTTETNITQKAFWGDVYNDYKQTKKDKDKDKLKSKQLQRASSARTPKFIARTKPDAALTGDNDFKALSDIPETDKTAIQTKSCSLANTDKKNKSFASHKSVVISSKSVEEEKFRKCFQVQQFDEIVRSFFTPSDRRMRAVCSRMKCKIRLFGPNMRVFSESKSHFSSYGNHDKQIYHLIIFTNSKDQLDKSLKCIQETFPKACLNERMIIQNNLENYGNEIPL